MSLHITNPLIMAFNVQEISFSYTHKKKNPYRGRGEPPSPPPSHTLPPLWPPLTNPGCTAVTGIAKMHKGPCSPLIGVKEIFKRGEYNYRGFVYATSHNYPLIVSFNVEENAVFIHEFSKKISLPWEGGHTPSLWPPPVEKSWLRQC